MAWAFFPPHKGHPGQRVQNLSFLAFGRVICLQSDFFRKQEIAILVG